MVEDNRNNHQLFIDAFEAAGFEVTILQNADGPFVEQVIEAKPDIISLDIMIGKSGADLVRGGLDALQLIKEDEQTKNIPVMMLSSFFEEGKVEQSKSFGAVDYINLQGQSILTIPKTFKKYLDAPKTYLASHPIFRS